MNQCVQKLPAVHSTYLKRKKMKHGYLKNFKNSFNAELCATRQLLCHLNKHEMDSAIIYTDSKSSIQAIANFKLESCPAIPEIIKTYLQFKRFRDQNNINMDTFPCRNRWERIRRPIGDKHPEKPT